MLSMIQQQMEMPSGRWPEGPTDRPPSGGGGGGGKKKGKGAGGKKKKKKKTKKKDNVGGGLPLGLEASGEFTAWSAPNSAHTTPRALISSHGWDTNADFGGSNSDFQIALSAPSPTGPRRRAPPATCHPTLLPACRLSAGSPSAPPRSLSLCPAPQANWLCPAAAEAAAG